MVMFDKFPATKGRSRLDLGSLFRSGRNGNQSDLQIKRRVKNAMDDEIDGTITVQHYHQVRLKPFNFALGREGGTLAL